MTKSEALASFWRKFARAYDETAELERITPPLQFPYITYQQVLGSFNESVIMTASLWFKDYDGYDVYTEMERRTTEISEYIGMGGVFIPCEGGTLWIKRGAPFAQSLADADKTIKRILFNVEVEYMTEN